MTQCGLTAKETAEFLVHPRTTNIADKMSKKNIRNHVSSARWEAVHTVH